MMTILISYGVWAMLNALALALLIASGRPAEGAYTIGFWRWRTIVIPPRYEGVLAPVELQAVISHEEGHAYAGHWLENSLWWIIFPPAIALRRSRREQQEREADDYAANNGYGRALASALMKLSAHPSDVARAQRLLARQ